MSSKCESCGSAIQKEVLLASPEEMKQLILQCKFLNEEWRAKIVQLIDKNTPYVSREEEMEEEILKPNPNRFVILPLRFIDVWIMYKLHEASVWTVEEIDFSQDMQDWVKLTSDEQFFLKQILAFFAASDGIVGENLVQRFMQEVQIPEAKCFYSFQLAMEMVHSFNYSVMIDTYVKKEEEKLTLFAAIHNNRAVRLKAQWALKWIHDNCASFAERLFAIACVEGIFFSSSFCAIFWLKKRGLMPGLTFSNELISRDEGLHMDFALLLYSLLKHRMSQEQVEGIVRWCVAIECMFVTEALPFRLLGMNEALMQQYICFVADRLLLSAGYQKIYNVENPFEFMELISLTGKTNFFEKRVAEYQRGTVISKTAQMIRDLIAQYGAKGQLSNFARNFVECNSGTSKEGVVVKDVNAFDLSTDF